MNAKLIRFKVENFRSIESTDWIDVTDTTCLVGTNESGKTNIMLALWKLKPANDEDIEPLIDYPRKKFVDFESTKGKEIFITADFELNDLIVSELSTLTGYMTDQLSLLRISRLYSGRYIAFFPGTVQTAYNIDKFKNVLQSVQVEVESNQAISSRLKIKADLLSNLKEFSSTLQEVNIEKSQVDDLISSISNLLEGGSLKEEVETYIKENVLKKFEKISSLLSGNPLYAHEEVFQKVYKAIPSFVYYSDYGNLDSEIYLPHVISNMERKDLGEKERAKSRTLKVLFDFVKLEPQEILELGEETKKILITVDANQKRTEKQIMPTEEQIEEEREKKKKREILLQSASTKLTTRFKEWWKQGNYKFRFQADGNHFRIWVSDEIRPEEVELEGRSRGLQWFFSFFLVFLVESEDTHSNCVLLLDEPGISLHPVAQIDLSAFFVSLSNENQLIYTTHSPFLVNADDLGGVKAVFVDDHGLTTVSSDLRANEKIASKSIYPIHAAIGLTVSETLLLGCQPVIVEGPSDQIYLQLIKNHLLSLGKYVNNKEMVFIPSGGVSGMSPIIKLITGRNADLPFVILDSDKAGQDRAKQLKKELYKDSQEKVILIEEIVGEHDTEVEDLLPSDELAKVFSKLYRFENADDFDEVFDPDKTIIPQMEKFAIDNGSKFELGWKVNLAKEFQKKFQNIQKRITEEHVEKWQSLFDMLTAENKSVKNKAKRKSK